MKCVGFVPGLNFRRPSHLTTAYVRKQYRSVDIHRLRLAESGVSADGTEKKKRRGRPKKEPQPESIDANSLEEVEVKTPKKRTRKPKASVTEKAPPPVAENGAGAVEDDEDQSLSDLFFATEDQSTIEGDGLLSEAGVDLVSKVLTSDYRGGRRRGMSQKDQEEDDLRFDEFLERGGAEDDLWKDGDDFDEEEENVEKGKAKGTKAATSKRAEERGIARQKRATLREIRDKEDDFAVLTPETEGDLKAEYEAFSEFDTEGDDDDAIGLAEIPQDEELSLFTDLGIDGDEENVDSVREDDEEDMSYIGGFFNRRRETTVDIDEDDEDDDEDEEKEDDGDDDDGDDILEDDDDFDAVVEVVDDEDDDTTPVSGVLDVADLFDDIEDDEEDDEAPIVVEAKKTKKSKSVDIDDDALIGDLIGGDDDDGDEPVVTKGRGKSMQKGTAALVDSQEDEFDDEDLFVDGDDLDDDDEKLKSLEDYDEDDRDEIDTFIGELITQRGVEAKVLDLNDDEYITVTEGPDNDFIWGDDQDDQDLVAYQAGLDKAPRINIFGGTSKEAVRRGDIVEGGSDWFARRMFEASLKSTDLAMIKWAKGKTGPPPNIEEILAERFPPAKLGVLVSQPTLMVSLASDDLEEDEDESNDVGDEELLFGDDNSIDADEDELESLGDELDEDDNIDIGAPEDDLVVES